MDASTPSIAQGLTTGDWLGILAVVLTLAGALGMIIFNMVMKRLDALTEKVDLTSDRVIKMMTKLNIEDVTQP